LGLFTVAAFTAIADPAPPASPTEWRDGYRWNSMSIDDKGAYMCGMIDGVYTGALVPDKDGKWHPREFTDAATKLLGEAPVAFWIKIMDRLYEDPANLNISTAHALGISAYARSGAPVSKVKKLLDAAREFGARAREIPPKAH